VSCTVPLRMGLKIEAHVIKTDKSAAAEVVYVDPERPGSRNLAQPHSIPLSEELSRGRLPQHSCVCVAGSCIAGWVVSRISRNGIKDEQWLCRSRPL
jgi:hypothetical protein